jgi:hypothetical protein
VSKAGGVQGVHVVRQGGQVLAEQRRLAPRLGAGNGELIFAAQGMDVLRYAGLAHGGVPARLQRLCHGFKAHAALACHARRQRGLELKQRIPCPSEGFRVAAL